MSDAYEAFEALADSTVEYYGDPAIYYPQSGNPIHLTAIFSSSAQREDTAFLDMYHYMFVRMADFPEKPKPGEIVEAFDLEYRIFDVSADFGGGWKLTLQRRSC